MFNCNYFWRAVYIGNEGHVYPCCNFDKDFRDKSNILELGNPEIQNSEFLKSIRREVMSGKQPSGCNTCVDREVSGRNPRMDSFERMSASYPTEEVPADQIEMIDLRIGNTCNFMCVMCGSNNSHLIAKEKLKGSSLESPIINWGEDKQTQIFNFLKKCTNLKHITIAGGEPFYNKKIIIPILESLYSRKDQVNIQIITNCSVYDPEVFDILKKFKKVSLSLSVDSIGQSNELQRWRSNNTIILDNIEKYISVLSEEDTECNFGVVPAVTNLTLTDIPELFKYFYDHDKINYIRATYVTWPTYMHIRTLKQSVRNDVAECIIGMNFTGDKIRGLHKFVNFIKTTPSTNIFYDTFIKEFSRLKELRGLELPQSFYDTLEK
jgi:sulfatase maturation enzyme AslB (radical SAM superfamily)